MIRFHNLTFLNVVQLFTIFLMNRSFWCRETMEWCIFNKHFSFNRPRRETHTGKMSGCSTTPINDLFLEDNKKPKTHISASDTLYSSTTILGLSTFELLFVLTMSYAKVQKISHICTCENGCNIHLDGLHCYCSKYREIYYSIFLHLLLLL